MAGPASLVAWAFVGLLGLPLALTFAALATRFPDAGGVATFAGRAFGPSVAGVTGTWYFVAGSVGQTIVPLTGGYYVADVVGGGQGTAVLVAAVTLGAAVAANVFGLRLSGRIQLVLAAGVGLMLLGATVAALPRLQTGSSRRLAVRAKQPGGVSSDAPPIHPPHPRTRSRQDDCGEA